MSATDSTHVVARSPRLEFRKFSPEDAAAFYELNADPEVVRHTGDAPFADVAAASAFINAYDHYQKHDYGRWSVFLRDGGEYVGFCGLKFCPDLGEVDLGFRLAQKFWGQGLATEASLLALDLGFHRYKLEKIVGRAMRDNPASQAVLKKAGMSPTHEVTENGQVWHQFEIDQASHRSSLKLRPMVAADMTVLYEQQKDEEAVHMAAFTAKDPNDAVAFVTKTKSLIANAEVDTFVVDVGGQVVGHVMGFEMFGRRSVCYWMGREYWGCGYATAALALFLDKFGKKSLTARVAHDNVASLRVLEKNGFVKVEEEEGFAAGRGAQVREFVMARPGADES